MSAAPKPVLPCVLAIDQGSHASKALVIDSAGRVLARAEAPIATARPRTDWVEHDAEALVESVRHAIDAALAKPGIHDLPIARAGLATQRSSIACWDRTSGAALSPVISWQDRRNAAWLHELALDPAWLHDVTGLVPSPHYGASKLRWCLDHLPAVRAAAAAGTLCCGPLSSFLVQRLLVGRPNLVDPANASRTLLWDLESGDWSPLLLERFGIDPAWLPRCVPSRHEFGLLPVGDTRVPLSVVTGDQSAALFARGEPQADAVLVNAGTGAFVQRAFEGVPPPAAGLLRSVAWWDSTHCVTVLEGTVNGAGAALEWLAAERGTSATEIVALLSNPRDTETSPPLFINSVGGLGSPFWIEVESPRFDRPAALEAEALAVLESIVFLIQANLDVMCAAGEDSAAPPARVHCSGGLSRLDDFCQRLADLSSLPVHRREDTEATARGLACLLGVKLPHDGQSACFDPAPRPSLRTRYLAWRRALDEDTSKLPR